ncbi:hypothetical protein R84981_001263 [Carnimonas sp. R-84981]|uniref:hypothetical protein n=1 Tax=Carnimonas bestiolae TaxID=3402172 RepID=UPI003EDC22C1
MNNDYRLIRIITNIAIFLEFSDDNTIDPDIAVGLLEDIAGEFDQFPNDSKQEIVNIFHKIASEYKEEKSDFIRTLPETLGII